MNRRNGLGAIHLAAGVLLAAGASPGLAQSPLVNGSFDAAPPSVRGWESLGKPVAKPPAEQGANSAWLGPTAGEALQGGAFRATTIWQKVIGQDPTASTFFRFSCHSFLFDARVWVEVKGGAGIMGAYVPRVADFVPYQIEYPHGDGEIEISFSFAQRGAVMSGGCKIDAVTVKHDTAPYVEKRGPTVLKLQRGWLKRTSTDAWERAIVELHDRRGTNAKRFTSPKGFGSVEGNSRHGAVVFSHPTMSYQQIDATHRGAPIPGIRAIGWRRDHGSGDNAAYTARRIQARVVLGHGDVQRFGEVFARNFLGAPTTVFRKKTVQLPDWTKKPAGAAPAPWSIRLPLDVRWSYDGRRSLVYQIDVTANSVSPTAPFQNYPLDFETLPGSFAPTSSPGTSLGPGCRSPGARDPFTLTSTIYNHKVKIRIRSAIKGAPVSTPVMLQLDTRDANATVKGLCAKLRALPTLLVPAGTSSATGRIARVELDNLPYDPALIGKPFFLQASAIDHGQRMLPFSLSNGSSVVLPRPPTFPTVGRLYSYTSHRKQSVRFGPAPSAIVTLFER